VAYPGMETQEKAEEHREGGFRAREILETIILTALIFLAVHFSIQPYRVDGPSMRPGLHTDELLIVNLLTYHFGSPQRGDVVVLHPPADDGSQYVKRIIGVPGDTIVLTPNGVSVDGTSLHETYIASTAPNEDMNIGGCLDFSSTSQFRIVLQKDQYYVMGDNRRDSLDSRCFGPVARDRLIGKAEVVLFPLDSLHWLSDYSSVFAGVKP
jgi:signal peptidase I